MGGGLPILFAMIWVALLVVPFWKLLPRYGISKYFTPLHEVIICLRFFRS